MKKSLIALGIILLCIIIIAVGCSEQIKFWHNPYIISDPNRVWIDDEHDIWFVINDDNREYYGKIVIDGELLKLNVETLRGNMEFFILKRPDDKYYSIINCGARYVMGKIILSVSYSDFPKIPKGTKLVFKPYPRQAVQP